MVIHPLLIIYWIVLYKDHSPSQKGRRYSTDRKANNSPPLTSPTSTRSPSPSLRERLYPITTVKKYIAVMDIEPQQDEDLRLTKGADVEGLFKCSIIILTLITCTVLYIGKGGYWEGRANGLHGWFPQNAIKEKTFGNLKSFQSLLIKLLMKMTTMMIHHCKTKKKRKRSFHHLMTHLQGSNYNCTYVIRCVSCYRSGIKTVAVHRGEKGFGFGMKGIKGANTVLLCFHAVCYSCKYCKV